MAEKRATGMIIDGVFASEAIDSSGEIVSIKGMNTSTMDEGYGVANYEHLQEDGNYGREIVGKIVYVHKIFKESDCEDDRQKQYWQQLKGIPFLYGVVRLYDGAGHPGAIALAAQIRDHKANKEPILVRYSIEGSTLKKDGSNIVSSIAKRVALTLKPCNRTCVSDVVADPNAPEGFDDFQKFEVPDGMTRLGGAVLECDPVLPDDTNIRLMAALTMVSAIKKAITAGNMDVAPSAKTGGAALQREDRVGIVSAHAKAVVRDWGDRPFKRTAFMDFAKAKMPEVSEDFLDHFADIAEAYHVKKSLAKAVKAPKASVKVAPKTPKAPKVARTSPHPVLDEISDEDENLPDELVSDPKKPSGKRKIPFLTRRGVAGKANVGMVRPSFDAERGILHTPAGSIHAYLPEHDGPESSKAYQSILGSPEIEGAMNHATENWHKLHKLLKAGKLPPEVLMHGVLFSMLSPNKPVPTQEIQYARVVDAMDATGIDPRQPGFRDLMGPLQQLDRPDVLPHTGREAIRNNPSYYQGGVIGPQLDAQGNRIGKPSLETGRMPGDLLSASPLINDFMDRMSEYHRLHDHLMGVMERHRHDSMGAVTELMQHKAAATNWQNKRRGAASRGAADPGPYTGPAVPGIKVKTGLYTWGMLGGGNSVVPDTHFVRNIFGLDLHKDAPTIEYLKQLMWRPTNMHVMRGLNQWYQNNHPAAKFTLNHPVHSSKFEKPDDALFPAFWRHWLTIAPHEQHLGLPNEAEQAGTTHAPYWDAISPHIEHLIKNEHGETSVPLRTAMVHQQYVKDFGETAAALMYHRFLVPKLLEAASHREKTGKGLEFLAKARALQAHLIELRKDVREALDGPEVPHPAVHVVHMNVKGKLHPAGRYMVHDGEVTHLEDYHGLLHSMVPQGPITAETVSRLHGIEFAPHFAVSPHEAPSTAVDLSTPPEIQAILQPPPSRPPVFEYHRPGMSTPHIVEFGGRGAAIDGRKLDDTELGLILDNVKGGLASLRYHDHALKDFGPAEGLRKDEQQDMLPDMNPADALRHVRQAVAEGRLPADVERALTRHIYEDHMVQGVGNKYAWEQFRAQNRPGTYVSIDGNDFKHLNDVHGHDAGDQAIRGIGGAIRQAADKVGTGKVFRAGGDEFTAHFPTMEEASAFARHARNHLEAIAPVNGVHRVSVSMGMGNDFPTADAALGHAKAGRMDPQSGQRAFAPGKMPNFAHSLVPGAEGTVPLHSDKLPARHIPQASPAVAKPTP